MKNNFWHKTWEIIKDFLISIGTLIALPFLIVYLILRLLFALIYAPFECAKYKKSAYYRTYKHKYTIDITNTDKYRICSKLLENGIVMQQITKQNECYWCLIDDNHLFPIFADHFYVRHNGRDRENPILENPGYSDTLTDLTEFIAEEELHSLDENKHKQFTIFIKSKNVDPELKYILNNHNIQTYSNADELVKLILKQIGNNNRMN